ncbi:MAG: SPW repeat protein [Rhodospirillales bacterium]|nr:SPW repeat protein [Rhodospirillales bacterium]
MPYTARNRSFWQDWSNLALGAWLIISPWLLGFAAAFAAAWNAWLVGAAVGILAIWAIVQFATWQEWVNLVLGLWLIVSPWILGFAAISPGVYWNFVVVGVLIAGLAAWNLAAHRHPPQVTA